MSKNKTTETTSESRPPVSYLVALNDKLQMNADKVERNIIETQQNLSRDIKKINEGRQPLYQEHINKTILNSLELLNTLDEDAAEASRLQHPQSEMIEKDMKQLQERVMKLREEHDRIYNCSAQSEQVPTVNREKKIDEKLDDFEWEVKRPSEVTTDADIKYSVSSSEGQHECSETGLRWRSDSDVSLEYRFVDWKSLSKDILKNYKPCGPLMDITVTSGTLEEIQLPHFVCVDPESSSDDAVKALHVKDGAVSVERCELSGFHAKLVNPTFSFLAIVVEVQQYFNMKFHCETLIYRNRTTPLNLHVYLILKDKKLKKDVEEKEQNNMEILKPTPDEALKMNDCYILKTSCDSKIKPLSLKLTPNKTNFFDLHIKDEMECLELSIETKEGHKIWDVNIESDEFNINSSVSDWRQKKINRSALIWQWWRRMLDAMEHSARARFETPFLPSPDSRISDLIRLRPGSTFQGRFSNLTGHQSAETDTAQKQKRCKNGEGAEFVEKHRTELIRKVSLVEPIADDMKPLIGDEKYQTILKSATEQEKMRALLNFLTTPKLKDKLYKSLVKHECSVVEYLEYSE